MISLLLLAMSLHPAVPARACTAGQLSLSFDGEQGNFDGMSHSGTLLVLRNFGASACTVLPRPVLSFEDSARRPVAFVTAPTPRDASGAGAAAGRNTSRGRGDGRDALGFRRCLRWSSLRLASFCDVDGGQ